MRIGLISVTGFRSLGNVSIALQDYTCLLGKNDCGKSSFLRALQLLFDPSELPHEDDYCKIETQSTEFTIEASLLDCSSNLDLASDGVIRIQRVVWGKTSKWNYWGYIPKLQILRNMMSGNLNKGDYQSASQLGIDIKTIVDQVIIELTPKGSIPPSTWSVAFQRLEAAGLVETEAGWCPLNPERISSLVQVVMLTADVRAEEEIANNGKSVLGRVGGLLVRESTRRHPGMAEAIKLLEEQVSEVGSKTDGQWHLTDLNTLETVLLEEIQRFDESIRVTSSLSPPKIPSMDFAFKLDISDEWVTGVGKMGHGLRRSVVFAMLRTLRRLEDCKPSGDETNANVENPLYLFLMEEPELYLHPQAEQRRMKELEELSSLPNAQVVLCTHSAFFVNLNAYKGIFRFNRQNRGFTSVQGWNGEDLNLNDRKTLQMLYFFDPTRAAMLFADLVILVEGQTEKVTIPYVAERMGLETANKEVVDCTGNGTMAVYQRVLEALKIRYVAWLDSDQRHEIDEVKKHCSRELGRIVLTDQDWEHMAKTGRGDNDKPFRSWKKYVLDNEEPTEAMKARITAAYSWNDYNDLAQPRKQRDKYDEILHG